jgi:mediator of RNA polymerase II transcription subunit 9
MIRRLLQFLLSRNAEQITDKLADSYPVRRLAQMVVSAMFRVKALTEEQKIANPKTVKTFLDKFEKNIKEEMEKAKMELENKQKK